MICFQSLCSITEFGLMAVSRKAFGFCSFSLDTASQKFDFLIELKVYSSRSSIAFFECSIVFEDVL